MNCDNPFICKPSARILDALQVGRPLGSMVLLIKVGLIAIFWTTSQRVHNELAKIYMCVVAIPITMEAFLHLVMNVVECLYRFPDMTMLNLLSSTHRVLELITRDTIITCTSLLILKATWAEHKLKPLKKRDVYRDFFLLLFFVGFLNVFFYTTAPNLKYAQIMRCASLVLTILFATISTICFIYLFVRLIFCRRDDSNEGIIARRRLLSIIPFLVLHHLAFVEFLPADYVHWQNVCDKLAPIPFLIIGLLSFCAYRRTLFVCCISPDGTEKVMVVQPTEEVKKTHEMRDEEGTTNQGTQCTPYYSHLESSIHPSQLTMTEHADNSTQMYPPSILYGNPSASFSQSLPLNQPRFPIHKGMLMVPISSVVFVAPSSHMPMYMPNSVPSPRHNRPAISNA